METKKLIERYKNGDRYFRKANLEGANLEGANLEGANLEGAYLKGADLGGANLGGANLKGADLYEANLGGAYLYGANLKGADLYEANLGGAYLYGANLEGACLTQTSLDPMASSNCEVSDFEKMDEGWCIGYRTKNSPHIGGDSYEVGDLREAPYFSVASTECHPGIFVLPTKERALEWGSKIVKIIFRPWECHSAGDKWRVRWLIVWEDLK